MAYWDGADPAYSGNIYLRWKVRGIGVKYTALSRAAGPGSGLGAREVASNPQSTTQPTQDTRWISRLLAAKARLSKGRSTPRFELNGLLILCRLMTAAMDGMVDKPCRIKVIGDSKCMISCCEAENSILNQWFGNRVGEINEHFQDWVKNCQVDPIYHTSGQYNPVDLSTRRLAKADKVNFGSEWQDGPDYLRHGRDTWPISRDFTRRVPREERRLQVYGVASNNFPALCRAVDPGPSVGTGEVASNPQSQNPTLQEVNKLRMRFDQVLSCSNSLTKVKGIFVRLLLMTFDWSDGTRSRNKEAGKMMLDTADYDRATNLVFFLAMQETY